MLLALPRCLMLRRIVLHSLLPRTPGIRCWVTSSPTTFSPCRRTHPLSDARCVFRRETEVLSKATPSLRRLLCQARQLNGPPSPIPRPRRDAVPQNRLGPFEDGPLRYDPPCKDASQGKE